jgi:hypothetical protein
MSPGDASRIRPARSHCASATSIAHRFAESPEGAGRTNARSCSTSSELNTSPPICATTQLASAGCRTSALHALVRNSREATPPWYRQNPPLKIGHKRLQAPAKRNLFPRIHYPPEEPVDPGSDQSSHAQAHSAGSAPSALPSKHHVHPCGATGLQFVASATRPSDSNE